LEFQPGKAIISAYQLIKAQLGDSSAEKELFIDIRLRIERRRPTLLRRA
jgi:hypothetical protein